MSQPTNELPTVWQEVRQRRVGKVVVAYLALAFGAIEAGIFLVPLLTAPEWFWRTALGMIVLGFPVGVVLAWTYDITPTGVVRTPDDLSADPEDPASRAWIVLTAVGIAAGIAFRVLRD